MQGKNSRCLRWLISKTFEKVSQTYNPRIVAKKMEDENKDYYGKAAQRIPVWALKPNQYSHKIIRAYCKAMEATGRQLLILWKKCVVIKINQNCMCQLSRIITRR